MQSLSYPFWTAQTCKPVVILAWKEDTGHTSGPGCTASLLTGN